MYDLEEQEKIDALKGWWQENRLSALAVVAVGVLVYAGITGWKTWKAREADSAATRYAAFLATSAANDPAKTLAAARELESAAASSPFAARAALAAAQALTLADKGADARAQYAWVIDHAAESQLQSIARIRLAGLLADSQQYPDALAALDKGIDPAFAPLAGDRRGDILLAQGKTGEARAAYHAALAAADRNYPLRQVLQTKVDALGATP